MCIYMYIYIYCQVSHRVNLGRKRLIKDLKKSTSLLYQMDCSVEHAQSALFPHLQSVRSPILGCTWTSAEGSVRTLTSKLMHKVWTGLIADHCQQILSSLVSLVFPKNKWTSISERQSKLQASCNMLLIIWQDKFSSVVVVTQTSH